MKTGLITFVLIAVSNLLTLAQTITPPSEGKAVVYFARTSSLGFAINFSYYDGDRFIGKFNGPKYLRYECEPGEHVFWARTENRDFVAADLEAGKIYFIEAEPNMGAIKAAVQLEPINPSDKKKMDKVMKLLAKKPSETFEAAELEQETIKQQETIAKGLEKYKENKEKGTKIKVLSKDMFYQE